MKVLLLGSGGREHALAWKIAQSPKVEKLFIAPGNAGTSAVGENVSIKAIDFPALKAFALEQKIDMIVVGPEDPLVEVSTTALPEMPPPNILPSSALQLKVRNWKAAKSSPKASWNVTVFPPPVTKASLLLIWTKALLSSKPSKLPTC